MEKIYDPRLQGYLGMINDKKRNLFFKNLLDRVAKDKIVLDLGSGTGILSFYALEAGAKHVYSIERYEISADCTQKILSDNFDSSRFTVLNLDFVTENLSNFIKDKIDILVTEQVGPKLFDGGNMCESWLKISDIISDSFISIPDKLHIDVLQWNHKLPLIDENYSNQISINPENTLNSKFSNSLFQFDKNLNSNLNCEYYLLDNFSSIRKKLPKPDKVHKDSFILTYQKIIKMFDVSEKIFNINSKFKFKIFDDFKETRTFIIIPKISFQSETLILQTCSTWDFNALCVVVYNSDSVTFSFEKNIVNSSGCWRCSK